MEVRGSVTDRPWGLTFGAIALRRHTGQLTIESDGKRYSVAFEDGAIVAASSPMAADAIARVALTSHLITSTQVPELTRRLAAAADRDEVDVLAGAIRFTPDQVLTLRQRLVAQRAARTFSLEHGSFVLGDQIELPVVPGVAIDHRQVIYLGVRTNVSEQRLTDELRQLGSQFMLRPEAIDELARFGFDPSAAPVVEALKGGTSLPELEAKHRDLDPRTVQAIIYALVSCAACSVAQRATAPIARVEPRPAAGEPTAPIAARPRTATATAGSRATLPQFGLRQSPTAYAGASSEDAGTNTPAAMRMRTRSEPAAPTPPAIPTPPTPRVATSRAWPPATTRPPALDAAPPDAEPPPAPPAAPATAAEPPPARPASTTSPRLAVPRVPTPSDADLARGFGDQRTPGLAGFGDQRTPGLAGFGDQRTLGMPGFGDQRTPTGPAIGRSPTGSPLPSRVSTDNALLAEAAFKRGELAMKRDQPGEAVLEFKAACDLHPQDPDYAGMLAWAKFCAAGDKAAIGAETRKALERAVFKSNRPERARFYLGRVERMLGRDKEALRHFQEVLDLKPNHADAASEIRAIEARLSAGGKGGGLFGRKR